jgi:hypothetical protein
VGLELYHLPKPTRAQQLPVDPDHLVAQKQLDSVGLRLPAWHEAEHLVVGADVDSEALASATNVDGLGRRQWRSGGGTRIVASAARP